MTTQALITLTESHWSGWNGGSVTDPESAQVWAGEKTILSPETLGHSQPDYAGSGSLFYEFVVERIIADVVVFAFRNLVVENKGGGINLSGPTSDKFILRWGETKRLATPTMDGGTSVAVTVNEMR
jgi:hypothetical protein